MALQRTGSRDVAISKGNLPAKWLANLLTGAFKGALANMGTHRDFDVGARRAVSSGKPNGSRFPQMATATST